VRQETRTNHTPHNPRRHPLSFDKHLQVFAQGSRPEEVFLLESGIVKLAYTLPDDSTQLFCLRYPANS